MASVASRLWQVIGQPEYIYWKYILNTEILKDSLTKSLREFGGGRTPFSLGVKGRSGVRPYVEVAGTEVLQGHKISSESGEGKGLCINRKEWKEIHAKTELDLG